MAVGDTLTLLKTETVPYFFAFGCMQHLTQISARIMATLPSQVWKENGVNTKLEIEVISPQHNPLTRFPAGNFGFNSLVGNGATFHKSGNNLIIDNEGSVETHTNTIELDYGSSDTFRGLVGITCRTNVIMSFYVCNGVYYVKLDYGNANNKGTAWQYKYNMYNQYWSPQVRYKEAYTTLNLHCAPNDDKGLYINGVSSYTCGAIALEGVYRELSFKFQSTCKLFVDSNSIDRYNSTGDDTGDIENAQGKESVSRDHISTLYFYCQERRGTNPVDFEEWHNHSIRFLVQNATSGGDPLNWQTSVVGYLDYGEGASKYSNHKIVKFHHNSGTIIKCEELINGEWLERAQPQLDIPFSAYRVGMQCTDGYTYVGDIQTNMMIFKSLEDYTEWKENPNDNTWGILENVLSNALVNTTMNTNNINFDVGLGECWILDQNNIKRMANLFNMQLNADLSNIVGNMLIGLGMYDNPVDVVCDLFVLPFDVSEFVTSELSEFALGIQPQEEEG